MGLPIGSNVMLLDERNRSKYNFKSVRSVVDVYCRWSSHNLGRKDCVTQSRLTNQKESKVPINVNNTLYRKRGFCFRGRLAQ